MDIGENVEYFMMSSDIMDKVSLASEQTVGTTLAYLELESARVQAKLLAINIDDNGNFNFGLQRDGVMALLLNHLLDRKELVVSIGERRFKVELLKLDSDECYLRSKR